MWPFKSLDEKIAALEDELAGKRAKLTALIAATKNAETLPAIYVQMSLDLNSEIAVNESRLKRLKAAQQPRKEAACPEADPKSRA